MISLRNRIFIRLIALLTLLILALSLSAAYLDLIHQEKKARKIYSGQTQLLATQAAELVLWDDRVGLSSLLARMIRGDIAKEYAFFERDSQPYIHTFTQGVPQGLLLGQPLQSGQIKTRIINDGQGGDWYDIAAAVNGSGVIFHLGISRKEIRAQALGEISCMALFSIAALLIGAIWAWGIARATTKEVEIANQALLSSEQRLHSITESVPDAIISADSNGLINSWNHGAVAIFGYQPDEIIGQPLDVLIPRRFQDQHNQAFKTATDNDALGLAGKTTELSAKRQDGIEIPIELSLGIWPRDDKPNFVAVIRDISCRKEAEEKKKQLEVQLYENKKFTSLKVMAGAIAHNFNNILTAVIGNLELAQLKSQIDPAITKLISNSHQAACRAAKLSGLMLTYIGQTHHNPETLNFSDLVSSSINSLRNTLCADIELRFSSNRHDLFLHADPKHIHQILFNLVRNSEEALGEEGGVIDISMGRDFRSPEEFPAVFQNQTLQAGEYVWMEVKDNGHGMDTEIITQVFDPFFTTKFTGRGMGMAEVLGMVRAHGGAITINSTPESGSNIRVFFPTATAPQSLAECENKRTPATLPSLSGSVLLADDEEMVLNMGKAMLQHLGVQVLAAHDGLEAVEICQEHGTELKCALLDIAMPRMDGITAFTRIKESHPDLPLFFISGFSAEDAAQQIGDLKPDGFLQKPYELTELVKLLKDYCA